MTNSWHPKDLTLFIYGLLEGRTVYFTDTLIDLAIAPGSKHITPLIIRRGLRKIGLCTSTRWSPGTWQTAIGVPLGSCQSSARANAETCVRRRSAGAATRWWS